MKKKISLILASALLAVAVTGCSTGFFSSEKEYNIACTDIFTENNIGDDANISVGRSSDIFTEALTAALKSENITINMNFASNYGEESLLNDIVLKLDYGEANNASLKIISNNSGEEAIVNGYYADEYFYSDTNGVKEKVKESFGAFLLENDGYTYNIDSTLASKFGCIEDGGNKIYFLQYDPLEYESALITSFEADGEPLEADETIVFNYANLMFEIDENNIMTDYTFTMNYDHTLNGETNSYSYTSKVGFTDIGSTKIDVLDDLDSYVDVTDDTTISDDTDISEDESLNIDENESDNDSEEVSE